MQVTVWNIQLQEFFLCYNKKYNAYLIQIIWLLYSAICFCHIKIYWEKTFLLLYPPRTKQETDGTLRIGWGHKGLFTKDCLLKYVWDIQWPASRYVWDYLKPDLSTICLSTIASVLFPRVSILNKDLCELLHFNRVALVWKNYASSICHGTFQSACDVYSLNLW